MGVALLGEELSAPLSLRGVLAEAVLTQVKLKKAPDVATVTEDHQAPLASPDSARSWPCGDRKATIRAQKKPGGSR